MPRAPGSAGERWAVTDFPHSPKPDPGRRSAANGWQSLSAETIPVMSPPLFRLSRSALLTLLLVVAGGLFAWWMVAQSDRELRASLLQQARTVAQAVNRDQVQALTGTAADLDRPDYQRLKEQFTGVRLTLPQCRFLYLLGRHPDGTVFFMVDSEPPTSKDYSPPGQVYAEVPAAFRRGFDSKVAAVEGPVRDRWGRWVSAVVPLLDPRTGAVLAVLGVDVDARDWKWKLASQTALPVGLVLVLFTGGATYLFALRRPSAPRNLLAALSLLVAGLLVTGMVGLYAKANGERNALREFELVGNEIRLDIFARLHAGALVLHSGAALFEASETVERAEWRAFIQGLRLEQDLPGIQGLGYAQLIPAVQLAAHVAEIRQQGFPNYQVWPAGDRETYSAILYLEPFTNRNLRAFGYDMFSEPVRRAAMERARDERSPALSGKVTLVQETDQDVQAGALMFVPVYRRGWPVETVAQRRAALQGWVYSPYRMADLVQGALRGWEARVKDRRIGLEVYDGEVLSAATLLYDNRSAAAKALTASAGIDRLTPVDFAGHRWTLRCAQPGGLAAITDYSSAWIALFGGTILNLLLFGLTLSLLTTRATAQRMAERLTQELRVSEASYRNHFVNSAAMMLMIDPAEGALLEANTAAVGFYGYPRERLLTLRISDLNTAAPAEVRQAMAAVMEGRSNRFEFQHRLADGSLREVEVSSGRIEFGGRPVLHSILQDITERKRGEHALQEALAEKTMLLKEVHHRVKNNLQIISSLLNLQAGQVQNQEVLDLLSVTRNRVQAMALLHENLYQSKNLAQLDLPDYVESLCAQLLRATGFSGGRIALEPQVESDKITLALDQAVPCGLVINELVTNALKHAFPGDRRGRIQVKLECPAPHTVRLTVADDGIGLPATLEPGQVESLGLQLVFMLTKQLHGTITFERGLGTTVQIQFPNPAKPEPPHE